MKKSFVLLFLLFMGLSIAAWSDERTAPQMLSRPFQGVALQLFGWSWSDIRQECSELGRIGYAAVQIPPVNEHVQSSNNNWWSRYQPVTYHLDSAQGSEQDFKNMIKVCHQAHVKVIVDVVLNHMASPVTGTTGTNGTHFKHYDYPNLNADQDVFTYKDFHHYDKFNPTAGNCQIITNDWKHRVDKLTACDYSGLPDLNQENPHVVNVQRKFLNYLLSLGVDGFRIDMAKHIHHDSLRNIFKNFTAKDGLPPILLLEVFVAKPKEDAMDARNYDNFGYATNFVYHYKLKDVFFKKVLKLSDFVNYLTSSEALHYFNKATSLVFVNNHDTEREMTNIGASKEIADLNPHTKTFFNELNVKRKEFNLANVFLMSWPYGVPQVYSSYFYNKFDDGAPAQAVWQNGKNTCFEKDSLWICQHRMPVITAMVKFYNAVQDAPEVCHLWENGNQVAFARCKNGKAKGYVVINNTKNTLRQTLMTGLAAGSYTNILAQNEKNKSITVKKDGSAEFIIMPYDAVVIAS